MLGFGAGVMVAASFWSLLNPAIELANDLGKIAYIEPAIGFILGGALIIIADILLEHKVKTNSKNKQSFLLVFAWSP